MPKIVDHEGYRKELLTNATAVFIEQGYAAVSMRDIARSIGVSTGTLYHYFPSKDDLFCHLFLHHARHSTDQLVHELCGVQDKAGRLRRMCSFFQGRCDVMQTQFLLSADLVRHELSPKGRALLRRWSGGMKKKLSELVGVDAVTGELIFSFLTGTLYSRTVSSAVDMEPVFQRFQLLLEKNRS